jgi:hypothetical protein
MKRLGVIKFKSIKINIAEKKWYGFMVLKLLHIYHSLLNF